MRIEQVFMTPRFANGDYGDEIDVSDYVKIDGLSKIKRAIDSTDFSVGIFRFNDLRLKCINTHGTFNENDSRSIFPDSRDKTKVRVSVLKINQQDFSTESVLQFTGIINDDATKQNITNDTITLVALSNDSVFRTTQVQAGVISAGSDVKTALISILSQPDITALLTVDPAKINPSLNFSIDTPSKLDNLEVKEALDLLLTASSSALLIRNNEVIIQSRENEETTPSILELRGRGELSNNANIISISDYNPGKVRQFNSVRLNEGALTFSDEPSISKYQLRQIDFNFPFVTNEQTLAEIGRRIAEEFRYPKIELKLRVPSTVSEGAELLDLVRVDAPFLRKPKQGNFLPVYGVATYGDIITPYPESFGSVQITSNLKFKIISIEDDPKTFITTLKLRQAGTNFNDGIFEGGGGAVYGEAVYGESKYGAI